MNHTLVVSHLKGGVGKTSTALNLSGGLALKNKRVLLIDLDPQANASSALGLYHSISRAKSRTHTLGISDVLLGRISINAAIYPYVELENVFVCPANKLLIGLPQELSSFHNAHRILKDALAQLHNEFDYVIIDTPPSVNLLTINALCAASEIIIPIQTEFFAMEGLGQVLETIEMIQETLNPSLSIAGIVLNMVTSSALSTEVCVEIKKHFPYLVFDTSIPRTIKIPESQSHALLMQLYAPHAHGTKAYNALAQEIIARKNKDLPWASQSLGEG